MKDIIQDRLNKISNLNDRRLLKTILYDVYENVVEYNMDMYKQLEERIYNEIDDPLDKFYIYTSLDIVQNIDPVSNFLHPMIPSDLDDTVYNMEEINSKLQSREGVAIASIFMKCDTSILIEILEQNKTYRGFIKTNRDTHEIQVSLRQCTKYIQEIEKLYRVFQYNGTGWNTINCPYAYKFVDIVLNSAMPFKEGEQIKEIIIDLAEYEQYKIVNAIPLWNVKEIMLDDKSFPIPAKDRINYDHVVSLAETGEQNGYLIGLENTDYLYCKRMDKDLVVVSSDDQQHQWHVLMIEDFSNLRIKSFPYELISNKRNLGFIGRYSSVKSMVIRTRGEIARLLQTYEPSKELIFQEVEIRNTYYKTPETVNYNNFVDDNIRVDYYKKIMILKFKPLDREHYLVQDKMSFLVSEMQILFPEYRCIGELV